jgi:hypothetical protein
MNPQDKEEKKCCGGIGPFGKCGRGTKEGCIGVHCKCVNLDKQCPNMHYVDCKKCYIHVEHCEKKDYTPPVSTNTQISTHPQDLQELREEFYRFCNSLPQLQYAAIPRDDIFDFMLGKIKERDRKLIERIEEELNKKYPAHFPEGAISYVRKGAEFAIGIINDNQLK